MNIYIINCSNTFNYGSMMMGENFITYFNKVTNTENKYYVETQEEINVNRLKEATHFQQIYAVKKDAAFHNVKSKYEFLLGYVKIKDLVSDFVKSLDLVVVLGGDDFTEDYGWKSPILSAIKLNLLKRSGLKIIMFGQTVGPYKSFRKQVMKVLLKKIDKIYTREPISFLYLKKLGLKNISLTDDLALLPLKKQIYNKRAKEYITFCPSELIYKYTKKGVREDWLNFNKFIISQIFEKYPDKKVVFIAHVLKPETADDRKIVNDLYNLLSDDLKEKVIVKNNIMYPFQVREYIQQSLFTISSRMHPVISSIQCEIPAIAISYSNKYWGIIGERYGLKEYIIDVRESDYVEMCNKFTIILDKIEKEYFNIQERMHRINEAANESILNSLKEITYL